ncbi:hypothetical protein AB0I50_55120, partial [Streptomyces prunicolor]
MCVDRVQRRCVAVPVFGPPGGVAAALSVTGPPTAPLWCRPGRARGRAERLLLVRSDGPVRPLEP